MLNSSLNSQSMFLKINYKPIWKTWHTLQICDLLSKRLEMSMRILKIEQGFCFIYIVKRKKYHSVESEFMKYQIKIKYTPLLLPAPN